MIQGEIETLPVGDLMQWIALTRRTGELTIARDDQHLKIYFEGGNIAAAFSSEIIAPNSFEYICTVLISVRAWRAGNFIFKDGPLPADVAATNLRLSVETTFRQLEEVKKPDAEPGLDEWTEGRGFSETFTLADALRLKIVDHLIREDFRVPPMPQLAARVLELTRDPNFSLRDLGNLILADQVVAAQIMRRANSVQFGSHRAVDTLPMAVQRLGSDEVVNVVLAASLQARRPGDLFADHKRRLWIQSSIAAFFARAIAAQVGLEHNSAFLCGLLMDFGMTVLYSLIQDVLGRGTTPEQIPRYVVSQIVEDYHPRVGRVVGEKWRLPQAVIDSMAYHHSLQGSDTERPYVAVSALADYLTTFALGQPRDLLKEASQVLPPERLASHPGSLIIGLSAAKAQVVLTDMSQLFDQALELVID